MPYLHAYYIYLNENFDFTETEFFGRMGSQI